MRFLKFQHYTDHIRFIYEKKILDQFHTILDKSFEFECLTFVSK